MIGFHGQRPIDNWLEAIKELPTGALFLSVDDVHMCRDAKIANPDIVTVFRKKTEDQHLPGITYEVAVNKARAYFDSFIDGTWIQQELWRYVDYVKEWNEYVATSDSEERRQEVITWLKAVNTVWNTEYRNTAKTGFRNIPLVCISAPIGNDIDIRYAKIVNDNDNVVSYHGYTNFYPTADSTIRNPADWVAYSGRWVVMDTQFRAAGIHVKWIGTEGGPFNSVTDGWKSNKVLNGDLQRYIDECIKYQLNHIFAWNEAHNNRYLGSVLFTFGRTNDDWRHYELDTGDMIEIAKAIKEYTPQPPPIDPPPSIDWKQQAWDESVRRQIENGISLNPDAALQGAILQDGLLPVLGEYWYTTDADGVQRAYMPAESLDGSIPRRLYFAVVPNWNDVQWFTDPKA